MMKEQKEKNKMKTTKILVLIIILGSCFSCVPHIQLEPIWYIDSSKLGIIENNSGREMVISGNKLICIREEYIIAINKYNGDVLWTYKQPLDLDYQRTPLIVNDKIFAITRPANNLTLTVLDLDGNLVNSVDYSSIYQGSILENAFAYHDNQIFIGLREDDGILGTDDGVIVSINLETYEAETIINNNIMISQTGKISIKDNTLYFAYEYGSSYPYDIVITAYDINSNIDNWKLTFNNSNIDNWNPVIHKNKMYASVISDVREIDLETGNILRTFKGNGYSGASFGDDVIFLPGSVTAYDLKTGEKNGVLVLKEGLYLVVLYIIMGYSI